MDKVRIEHDLYDLENEKKNLKSFLQNNNFQMDARFLEELCSGDIIEVYAVPDQKQIYANQEFARLSSYTSEQMQTVPFQKLFWRDPEIQQSLIRRAQVIIQSGRCQKWDLPPHDLIEALHPRRRTFEVHMGCVAPVTNSAGEVVAWATTIKVEYIFELPRDAC